MLWVDQASYFGPDRRRKAGGLRIRERRRENFAGRPPALNNALRQLRMRVLDANGDGVDGFVQRTDATALLAQQNHEPETARTLAEVSSFVARNRSKDVRQALYRGLDRAHAVLRTQH